MISCCIHHCDLIKQHRIYAAFHRKEQGRKTLVQRFPNLLQDYVLEEKQLLSHVLVLSLQYHKTGPGLLNLGVLKLN